MAFAATAMAAQPVMCQQPKVNSFDFLLDYSGSMMMKHKVLAEGKFALAQKILAKVNERIPELGYMGSIHTFAANKVVLKPQTYNRSIFGPAFKSLKSTYEVFNRLTPMGDGINTWSQKQYNQMAGPAAVIIVSDGECNRGADPLLAAQAALAANPGLTFHIISLADTPGGQALLDSIAALRPGSSVSVTAQNMLESDAVVDQFVADVFCGGAPAKIVLRSVQFALDSSQINAQSAAVLDEVAGLLQGQKRMVEVSGHTCSLGTDAYNMGLSERRAAAVKAYLVGKGIPASEITTRGYGESMPKFDNSTDEGRRLNRRAEIDFK
jgi:OOP family OmpA-OmpF porin